MTDEGRGIGTRLLYALGVCGVPCGLAAGIIYIVSPIVNQNQLEEHNAFCSELLERAEGNEDITKFVNDEIIIPDGHHKGKTCYQIIDEFDAGVSD
jgi:hypothetical protein